MVCIFALAITLYDANVMVEILFARAKMVVVEEHANTQLSFTKRSQQKILVRRESCKIFKDFKYFPRGVRFS